MTKEQDKVTKAIDIIFKMNEDGRMDEEESKLFLDIIFSGQMDEMTFGLINFIYKVRPHDNSWLHEEEDDGYWEFVLDPSNWQNGKCPLDMPPEKSKEDEE